MNVKEDTEEVPVKSKNRQSASEGRDATLHLMISHHHRLKISCMA